MVTDRLGKTFLKFYNADNLGSHGFSCGSVKSKTPGLNYNNGIFYCLSRQEILFPLAEKVFKKATADVKKLKINSFH